MSYFGTSGPSQDAGFIGGIARGEKRLKNARKARRKHISSLKGRYNPLGYVVSESDIELQKAAYWYANRYPDYLEMTKDPSRYEESEQQTLVENYERDRKEIIDAAAEYPELTRRSTTVGVSAATVAICGGAIALYFLMNNAPFRTSSRKGGMYAVFG
mgnify:FL=1